MEPRMRTSFLPWLARLPLRFPMLFCSLLVHTCIACCVADSGAAQHSTDQVSPGLRPRGAKRCAAIRSVPAPLVRPPQPLPGPEDAGRLSVEASRTVSGSVIWGKGGRPLQAQPGKILLSA